MPRFYWLLLSVSFGGLFLRILNLIQTSGVPTSYSPSGDAAGYLSWASHIAAGNWLGERPFYQAPLYPYALAILIKGFAADVAGIRFVQTFLGAASVGLIGFASRQMFGCAVGLISAAIFACYAPAIYYDGIIQKASLASFLLCGLLAFLSCQFQLKQPRWVLSVGMGVCLGLLTLTRENALLWTPLPLLWFALGTVNLTAKQRTIQGLAYCSGLFIILFPVAARNACVGGEWSPTTFQSGPNFYIGNNLDANGIYQPLVPGHETPMYERADAQRLAEQAAGHALTAGEVSSFWMSLAIEEIRSAPAQWLELLGLKCLMVVNQYEVPDVESMRVYRQFSTPLKMFGSVMHFGVLCPLAMTGVALCWRDWRQHWLWWLLTTSMVAAVAIFFVLGRYRFPLVPLMCPFAAFALHSGWTALSQFGLGSIGQSGARLPLICGLATAVICNLPIHDEVTLEASSLMNQGAAAGQAGNLTDSIDWLSRAIQMQPQMPEAYFNLGRAFAGCGRYGEAVRAFDEAQRQAPNLVMVDFQLANALENLGDFAGAVAHYRRALALDPGDLSAAAAIQRLQSQ